MENNVDVVQHSAELRDGARALVQRARRGPAHLLLDHERGAAHDRARAGARPHRLGMEELGNAPDGAGG